MHFVMSLSSPLRWRVVGGGVINNANMYAKSSKGKLLVASNATWTAQGRWEEAAEDVELLLLRRLHVGLLQR